MNAFQKRVGFSQDSIFQGLWIGFILLLYFSSASWAQNNPPSSASSSQTIKTLNELAPFIADIPGLDSLPVSNVEVTDDVTSATITLKGVSTTVVGFKIGDVKQIALIPQSFSFDKFIPGVADDALSKIALTNTVLILNKPGGESADINTSDLPQSVSSAIGEGSEKITLKSGVNLRAKLDLKASGEIADLLSKVGVSEVKLPLNGRLIRLCSSRKLQRTLSRMPSSIISISRPRYQT
jgi:hypothetical protein